MDTRYKGQKRPIAATRVKAHFRKQDEAKVKVQYIQNHQLVEKTSVCRKRAKPASPTLDTEIEGENVEYLDESISEDQATKFEQSNGNKSATTTDSVLQSIKKPFKDTFFPNAIHCLIDLYKRKYVEMKGKNEQQIQSMNVWEQIEKDMNGCLFRFDRSHIKEKFKQLRGQYFGLTNSQEADEFQYFDQLHDLYQDKYIDAIAAGVFKRGESEEKQETVYCDEVILKDDEAIEEESDKHEELQEMRHFTTAEAREHKYQTDTAQEVNVHTNSEDEIAHKEHEFIDMVEKELQTIVNGVEDNGGESVQEMISNEMFVHEQDAVIAHEEAPTCTTAMESNTQMRPPSLQTVEIKSELQEEKAIASKNVKSLKVGTKVYYAAPHVVKLHVPPASQSYTHVVKLHVPPVSQSQQQTNGALNPPVAKTIQAEENTKLTLVDYNAEQERRHREKVELFQRSLSLQERALEIHCHYMEELIKRL